ncbi:hypothetical protein VJJ19_07760, partial [Parvimonas sp. D4]|uniref:hypothetical protein n=1 Tax=Parvimonas sp. D4 TaxID=3110690 RepID=UPI002B46E472
MASADILRAAHAPLPWSVQRSAVSDRIVSVSAADSFGDVVALSGFASHITSYGDEASHNTEFVVRACNA